MPDLIVADIGLPDEDGYVFIARVREREGGGADRVPALALTTEGRRIAIEHSPRAIRFTLESPSYRLK
jgi:CheY-like chemotaxis protein